MMIVNGSSLYDIGLKITVRGAIRQISMRLKAYKNYLMLERWMEERPYFWCEVPGK